MGPKALIGAALGGAVALILVLTNPSLADFSSRMNSQEGFLSQFTCQGVETGNYVVFSRYEYRCMTFTHKYVGVFGNYYRVDSKQDPAQAQN